MKRALSVAALALTLGACRPGASEPNDLPAPAVSGTFRWIGSSGSIAGRTLTPASEKYTARIEFGQDQVRAFRNDTLQTTSSFTVTQLLSTSPQTPVPFVKVHFSKPLDYLLFDRSIEDQLVSFRTTDTLILDDGCCDRYAHVFVRVN